MPIDRKELFSISHYEYGQAYFGSCDGMRYRVARNPLANVIFEPAEKRVGEMLRASIWPEPYGYAHTDPELTKEEDFPFSAEGLDDAVRWLNGELEKRMKKESHAAEDVNRLRRQLEEGIDSVSEGLEAPPEETAGAPETVRPGDVVRVASLGTEATVLTAPTDRGEVQLASGSMKFKAKLKDLRLVKNAPVKEKTTVKAKTGMLTRSVPMECDVRGMSLEEASGAVEIYLDEAVLAGLNEVSVIHGKGTGVLRSGLRQELRKNRHVKSIRPGMYGEGEDGVTVVTLR